MSVVIVGGTAEGRELAGALMAAGVDVWTTLAGRTAAPRALPGRVRHGGFGGDHVMADWLDEVGAACLVDATHPFAAAMTARCARLARAGRPVLRLQRPGWGDHPDAGRWTWVGGHDEAAAAVAGVPGAVPGAVLLAVGRQELGRYARLGEASTRGGRPVIARVVDSPDDAPGGIALVRDRGPYDAAHERAFFDAHGVGVVVAKDAGGDATRAKLDVAAERGQPVVLVRRPPTPAGLRRVATVAEAVGWVADVIGPAAPPAPRRR